MYEPPVAVPQEVREGLLQKILVVVKGERTARDAMEEAAKAYQEALDEASRQDAGPTAPSEGLPRP